MSARKTEIAPTLGQLDLHLFGQGRHERLWEALGAHVVERDGKRGVSFAVWAPNARAVSVVGDFNAWDAKRDPLQPVGDSGIWSTFVSGVEPGTRYKYQVVQQGGRSVLKMDPMAFATEVPPKDAALVAESTHRWGDSQWMQRRAAEDPWASPLSVYECHLGSWRRHEDGSFLSYRELAGELGDYLSDLGFTHVELLPPAEHPLLASWGYQVSAYYAPTARYGGPDDFRYLIDTLHQKGIGVIIDWVPAHFPRDEFALARFDGTHLYEHADPRKGEHPDWGTLIFNFGRHEVKNFLLANALYWLEEFHVDGLRVDAVASLLYLDYSRKEGQWIPNIHGGRENLEAIAFLRELNAIVHRDHPGALMIAEESTDWPGVSRPTHLGGLGFGFKWNMGWMHDTLHYFSRDPIYRKHHHQQMTFGLLYAFHENFVLPLSHDEVVHGKASLLNKMPGDRWQQTANLRALLAWMWAHPGKQLLFMGAEIAQDSEWSHDRALDWQLLQWEPHRGVQELVKAINHIYREEPALWERDFSAEGFRWIDANDSDNNVLTFLRFSTDGSRTLACLANLSPLPRESYRIGLPSGGRWQVILNTDAPMFHGSGLGPSEVEATAEPHHGLDHSAEVTLPPLSVLWLRPE